MMSMKRGLRLEQVALDRIRSRVTGALLGSVYSDLNDALSKLDRRGDGTILLSDLRGQPLSLGESDVAALFHCLAHESSGRVTIESLLNVIQGPRTPSRRPATGRRGAPSADLLMLAARAPSCEHTSASSRPGSARAGRPGSAPPRGQSQRSGVRPPSATPRGAVVARLSSRRMPAPVPQEPEVLYALEAPYIPMCPSQSLSGCSIVRPSRSNSRDGFRSALMPPPPAPHVVAAAAAAAAPRSGAGCGAARSARGSRNSLSTTASSRRPARASFRGHGDGGPMSVRGVWQALHDPSEELAWPDAELPRAKARPGSAGQLQRLKAESEWARLARQQADCAATCRDRKLQEKRDKAAQLKDDLQAQCMEKAYLGAVHRERDRLELAKAAREADMWNAKRDAEEAQRREDNRQAAMTVQAQLREQIRRKEDAAHARVDPVVQQKSRQMIAARTQAIQARDIAVMTEQRRRKQENAAFIRAQVMDKAQRFEAEKHQENAFARSWADDAEAARREQRQEMSDRQAEAQRYGQELMVQMAERNQRAVAEVLQGMNHREKAINIELLNGACVC